MAIEYRGEEFLFLVEVETELGETLIRPFNQTGGSVNIAADAIELSTKDKTGSDYGDVTQEITLEGIITEGDPFVDEMKKKLRNKELVKIYEVNTRTKKAEYGMYMVSAFDRDYAHPEYATYSLTASLNGDTTEETLIEIPDGAPGGSVDDDDNGVEG